jgi:hypothetical protein
MTNNKTRTIIGIISCMAISSLPVISLAATIGIDTLADSYHNPTRYHYTSTTDPTATRYLVIQTIPQTTILHQGDSILYQTDNGPHQATITTINTQDDLIYANGLTTPLHPHEIIGKITTSLPNNPWTQLCLQLWDFTTQTLNPITTLNL